MKRDTYVSNLNRKKATFDHLLSTQEQISATISQMDAEYADKLTLQGQLQAEAGAQENRIADRATLIASLSAKHSIPADQNTDPEEFVNALTQSCSRIRMDQDKTRSEMKEGEDRLLAQISTLRTEIAGYEEGKKNSRKLLDSNRNAMAQLNSKIQASRVSQADIETYGARLEDEVFSRLFLQLARNGAWKPFHVHTPRQI